MLITYSIIIVLTFSVFGIKVLDNYKLKGIKNEETRLFQTANVVADTYKRNLEDIVFARIMVKSYANQAGVRILVVDKDMVVLVDNYNSYIGKTLNNKEIRSSINGRAESGVYNIGDKEVLQLSVPITMSNGLKVDTIGAVLVSTSLEVLVNDIEDLKNDIINISLSALLGALALTAIAATGITKSLRNLILGVEEISSGHLGYRIKEESSGEIKKLINTFNEMSERLKSIEKNRKSFINSISHELKTPLTSIKALIESLALGNNDLETYKEYLNDIKGETERMEDLVNYLMGSIKLEDISLDITSQDIGEMLHDTVKLISPYAENNGVRISFRNLESVIAKCDKDKIREVLLNIIDNAIKYSDDKKEDKYILITLKRSKEKAIIEIEDNGIGIDEDDLSNIFHRGFRVLDSHTIKKTEGYGIGLSIVKSIIDKHNWSISVKSSPQIGSIFTIEIPL